MIKRLSSWLVDSGFFIGSSLDLFFVCTKGARSWGTGERGKERGERREEEEGGREGKRERDRQTAHAVVLPSS
jgi:hypothetical protein